MARTNLEALLSFLLDLIVKPGTSLQLVPLINTALVSLLILMALLTFNKIHYGHLLAMSGLSLGLLASVNWYVCTCAYHHTAIFINAYNITCMRRFYYEFQKFKQENEGKAANSSSDGGREGSKCD